MSATFVSVEETCQPAGQPEQNASTEPTADTVQDVVDTTVSIKGRFKLLASQVRSWLISPTPGNTPQQLTRALFLLSVAGGLVAAFVYGFPQLVRVYMSSFRPSHLKATTWRDTVFVSVYSPTFRSRSPPLLPTPPADRKQRLQITHVVSVVHRNLAWTECGKFGPLIMIKSVTVTGTLQLVNTTCLPFACARYTLMLMVMCLYA